ncbi:MAG: hypothetical protein KC466_17670, partial [Myxococcales bacterium]|nr:hypothetical protein [Myxococcales bacterium]
EGKFHLYPVETIDQGIELLTGVRAGEADEPGTLNHAVAARLGEMAERMRAFAKPPAEKSLKPPGNDAG